MVVDAHITASGYTPGCWFAQNIIGSGPCDGQLVRVHLVPRQLLRREGLKRYVNDERLWVWGCGGPVGIGGHHGMLDHSRTLRIPRALIPDVTEQACAELGLSWWLDRSYGLREAAA